MIEFLEPPLNMELTKYMQLAQLWKSCSSCAGYCTSLGSKFFNSGHKDVNNILVNQISSKAPEGISPRVLPAYAIVYWFAREVCKHKSKVVRQKC